jgi:PPOX class probable F420-dependent enzyme
MELEQAMAFVRQRRNGVLTTLKRDGRPQLSNIVYGGFPDGTIRISATAPRAKATNLRRDPRASLYVGAEDFQTYVVVEADSSVTPTAADPYDATVDGLIEVYRVVAGEHDDWDAYRRAMVADQRLVLVLTPRRAYGMLGR